MGLRVLIYAQDTRGLGHVRRCGLIAQELLRQVPDAAVLLVTKSSWAARLDLGERFDLLKLPAQFTQAGTTGDARTREQRRIRGLRAAILRDAVEHLEPNLVLADNEPLGYGGELAPALERLPAHAHLVFGLRDVVDEPRETLARWERLGVMRALEDRFDRVLVYGHPDVTDTLEDYALPAAIRRKATFTGYVCRDPVGEVRAATDAARRDANGDAPPVVVSGGGGHDAVAVLHAALDAAATLEEPPRLLLVTGPFMAAADRAGIARRAGAGGHELRESVDLLSAMARARAVVSMGGYNTMIEAVALGRRPIVMPRHLDKREQLLRARAFARLGLAHCVEPGADAAGQVAAALRLELASPTVTDARAYLDVGARRTVEFLREGVGR